VSEQAALARRIGAQEREKVAIPSVGSAVRLTHSLDQAIPTGAWTLLTWDTEEFDTGNYHNPAVNPSRITFPTAGYRLTFAEITFASNGTGSRFIAVSKNGVTSLEEWGVISSLPGGGTFTNRIGAFGQLQYFAAGDWITCSAYQTSGASLNVVAPATSGLPLFFGAVDIVVA
jgi:hypothetical protein